MASPTAPPSSSPAKPRPRAPLPLACAPAPNTARDAQPWTARDAAPDVCSLRTLPRDAAKSMPTKPRAVRSLSTL
jgi:hypothetical protein